ncbi:MAG: glycosyltransferase [Desulfarculaceae bacterium]|nr:glycosyltransferase [Desulfarculaceae bacterium]MCF8073998.1 glycosyltransferase [Desulfarculaceae bacterium]MCF8102684.1 glycosyltransferase [Desulfarculaceae bacterium]MCF8116075.1 glycosyltransferase [Desulfarculaceae bacterium]
MRPRPDISFVIITHNDAGKLHGAVGSAALRATTADLDWEIWVVDNGSHDGTDRLLREYSHSLGSRLKVIYLPENKGTTVSRNLALHQATGRVVCVMDSDAELLENGLGSVIGFLDRFPEVGILAPRIIMPDGSTYDSVKRLPTLTDKLRKLPGIVGAPTLRNTDWYPDFPFEQPRPVHTAISCCWFFRREIFDLVGPLDERIFYSPEDVDWCLRCWKAGKAVVYFPYFRVMHHTRQISHKRPFSRLSLSHMRGILYYLGKHGYCFNRNRPAKRHIDPLAEALAPRLLEWERLA